MPKNAARAEQAGWLWRAAAIVLALTALRVALLAVTPLDLFVDEAQYWLWGQELAFGYYSKPPMIGWVIRAVTELAGSDAPFWVRLPGPLFHAATALILAGIAARPFGARAAVLVAAGYATLPMVALASILISTDTVMFPFLALALAGYVRLLNKGGTARAALLTGLALGLAFLSKYAAIYYLICAALAAAILPGARPRPRDALIVLAAFAVTIAPNIGWNILNGFSTVEHTLDNADWVRDPASRAGLNVSGFLSFFASQFAVFGPVLFGGLLWMTLRARGAGPERQVLLIFSLPILAIVCVQALLSGAYANWAAAAYLAGTVTVLPWLSRPWLILSFAINGALSLALPLAGALALHPALDGNPALARYLGRAAMSTQIITAARQAGLSTVVAQNRDILADLFYTGRDSGLRFYAPPATGRAPHHYALKYPVPADAAGPVLFVSDIPAGPGCAPDAAPLGTIAPDSGAYRGKVKYLFAVPATCWATP
ncbi:hypothetical protein JT55_02785 [Rhodovulum sp. NI22]|nr:hypothetical protein JT55_02785 [Rhodovulum sp. NI22]